jgi:hypothetical protein
MGEEQRWRRHGHRKNNERKDGDGHSPVEVIHNEQGEKKGSGD